MPNEELYKMTVYEEVEIGGDLEVRDILWAMRALRGDFGKYDLFGPYAEDTDEPFVVLRNKTAT